jgi:Tol biopolymer transport system component
MDRISTFLRALALAAAAAILPACEEDVGEGDQPGIYTVRVSTSAAGLEVTSPSTANQISSLSDDGRFVAFESDSPELKTGDGNGVADIFVKDRSNGSVELVSINTDVAGGLQGAEASLTPMISGNGRHVVFESLADLGGGAYWTLPATLRRIFRHDRLRKLTRAVYAAGGNPNSNMLNPSVSEDGRYVAFASTATNLLGGITYNGVQQVFLADLGDPDANPQPATVFTLISRTAAGATVACDGFCDRPRVVVLPGGIPFVVFESNSDNLISPAAMPTSETRVYGGSPGFPCELISRNNAGVASDGLCNQPSVSRDGRFVSFTAFCPNISTLITPNLVAVRDRTMATTVIVSLDATGANLSGSFNSSLSADGSRIAWAARLPGGGFQQIWSADVGGSGSIASVHLSGALAADACSLPWLSGDGRWVSFHTKSANLITTDTNGQSDIFVRGPLR